MAFIVGGKMSEHRYTDANSRMTSKVLSVIELIISVVSSYF